MNDELHITEYNPPRRLLDTIDDWRFESGPIVALIAFLIEISLGLGIMVAVIAVSEWLLA